MYKKDKKTFSKNARNLLASGLLGLTVFSSCIYQPGIKPVFAKTESTTRNKLTQTNESVHHDETETMQSDNSGLLYGGAAAISGQIEGLGYATQLYNATNGLPTSDANTILAASDGFIWIGGYSGLIQYDGTSFERQDSSSGITSVNALFEDHKSRLWVGTNDNGIVMLDKGTSKHWDYAEGISASSVRTITEDAAGDVLFGTTQGIDYIDEEGTLHSIDEPQLKNAYILYMKADNNGIIYGHTKDGSAFCIKDKKVTAYYNGKDMGIGNVTAIYPSPYEAGQVYLGTDTGMLCIGSLQDNFSSMKTFHITLNASAAHNTEDGFTTDTDKNFPAETLTINRIYSGSSRMWLLCGDYVGYLDDQNNFCALSNLPMNNSFDSMTEDFEGNLWFASDRQGVMKIVANKFANVTEAAGLESNVVNATCLHDDRLYIGTDSGLQIISYTEEEGLLSNQTRGTSLADDGSVLVGSNGGLNVIKDGKIVKSYGSSSGISNTVLLTVAEGTNGEYYLGTDGDGIYVIDGSNVTRKGREDGLTSNIILRIKRQESTGIYWIITSNSIEYMKDGVITVVSNFPYTNNYDIYFDDLDNAWVLSSYGVFVAKTQDLLDNEKNFSYQSYDISNGLLCVPTGNSYSAKGEDGVLYIAGRSGVCSVNIDNYFSQTHRIKLSVPYVEANGSFYYPDENNEITLPASAKTVKIYNYALTYSMQNPKLEYCLHGFDKENSTVMKNEMKPIRYTNLGGGKYTFELSVINIATGEKQQTLKLILIKEKTFYEEIWFYIFIAVLALICIFGILRLYLRYKTKIFMKREEKQKTLIREIVKAFSKTIDMKDKYTNGHSGRVADYTVLLAKELGYDDETVEQYYNIALLHDIGKIGIPEEVLNKPGKLTEEEYALIKSHSALGYNVLKDISIMPELSIGAGAHHERPDGKGYPKGLKGDEIPRVAQIIAVADTFDAMYSNRPYRKRMNFERAVSIIKEVSGTQLTPDVVDAFLRLVEKGEFRSPDDNGGGTVDDINNIRKTTVEKA